MDRNCWGGVVRVALNGPVARFVLTIKLSTSIFPWKKIGETFGESGKKKSRRVLLGVGASLVFLLVLCHFVPRAMLLRSVIEGGEEAKITKPKDVIEAVLNFTITTVQHNYFTLQHIIKTRLGLSPREKAALHDCLEMVDDTLDELHKSALDLQDYSLNKSISQQADDLITLLSAAMTNQETCIDGFSHDGADKKIRKGLCCWAAASGGGEEATATAIEWPEWLSAGDRRLLQASTVTADVTVAADGSGNYKTVGEAVAAAPERSSKRYIIRIKAGVYKENVEVPKKKTNIMFVGDGRTNTIITASRNVVDGSTTFHSATVGKNISNPFLSLFPQ
ncbi:Pectinesterase/pectinesterase inhibitor U1 [Vitis vinifera]|uniref:Pectinesterase n=1 Tax=Vitis vinifera TaxID=29760 RepID=A0A438GXZ5_VITVI|nr:Pectinesterase/pectinesterase inhibitor U1 [Vitis vinifera]